MPYDALTPARFKQLKPQFVELDDDVVQQYIELAGRFVDQSWLEADYETAWAAMTCHLMTLDGLGTSTEAELATAGGSRVTSLKSGTLSLTFAASASPPTQDEFSSWLGETACGRFYRVLLRLNRAGPRLLTAWGAGGHSGYAKDWPWIGRGDGTA